MNLHKIKTIFILLTEKKYDAGEYTEFKKRKRKLKFGEEKNIFNCLTVIEMLLKSATNTQITDVSICFLPMLHFTLHFTLIKII